MTSGCEEVSLVRCEGEGEYSCQSWSRLVVWGGREEGGR